MNLPEPAAAGAPTAADSPPEPPETAEVARLVGERWTTWYGHHTRHWWATPRRPYPWLGLVEGRTPADLVARVREVEACYGPTRPGRRAPVGHRDGTWSAP